MKVCHFTSVHKLKDTRIYLKECVALADAGYDVCLVHANEGDEGNLNFKTVAVKRETGKWKRILFTSYRVYKEALNQNAAIYQFHDPELLPYGLLMKWKGKKVIYDVHEEVPNDILNKKFIPKILRKPASILMRLIENFVAKRMVAVVGATENIAKRFKQINPNTVEVNNYPFLDELVINQPLEKEDAVIYVGSITENRGLRKVVKALHGTNMKLFLGGDFAPAGFELELRNEPGWENVEYIGYVDRVKYATFLNKSIAGLAILKPIDSHLKAKATKLFEYISASVPVICSNFPMWQDFVDEYQIGMCVDPENVEDITKAYEFCLQHKAELKKMGDNGRKCIEEHFNWDVEKLKLLELYEKLTHE